MGKCAVWFYFSTTVLGYMLFKMFYKKYSNYRTNYNLYFAEHMRAKDLDLWNACYVPPTYCLIKASDPRDTNDVNNAIVAEAKKMQKEWYDVIKRGEARKPLKVLPYPGM